MTMNIYYRKNEAFENFRRCVDDAPAGSYDAAKELAAVIGDACDNLMKEVRALGLKADACDLIYHVEATIYEYVKRSNPQSTIFPVSEGFGSAMSGPARDRVIAQAKSNVEFLQSFNEGWTSAKST